MSRDFDSEIAAAEAHIRELQGQLALHRQQFLEVATAYIAEWFDATARQFAREQGAVTESLRGERLATLKADVEVLKQRAPTLVEEHLNRPELWYDLGASGHWMDVGRERLPRELESGMRLIAGQLTGLLERSGYQQPSPTRSGQFSITTREEAGRFSYLPSHIVESPGNYLRRLVSPSCLRRSSSRRRRRRCSRSPILSSSPSSDGS